MLTSNDVASKQQQLNGISDKSTFEFAQGYADYVIGSFGFPARRTRKAHAPLRLVLLFFGRWGDFGTVLSIKSDRRAERTPPVDPSLLRRSWFFIFLHFGLARHQINTAGGGEQSCKVRC